MISRVWKKPLNKHIPIRKNYNNRMRLENESENIESEALSFWFFNWLFLKIIFIKIAIFLLDLDLGVMPYCCVKFEKYART